MSGTGLGSALGLSVHCGQIIPTQRTQRSTADITRGAVHRCRGSDLVDAECRRVVAVGQRRRPRAERRPAGPVRRHRRDGGRGRRQRVGLLDDEVHRHLALETVDVALAEVVAQLVHLRYIPHHFSSVNVAS